MPSLARYYMCRHDLAIIEGPIFLMFLKLCTTLWSREVHVGSCLQNHERCSIADLVAFACKGCFARISLAWFLSY